MRCPVINKTDYGRLERFFTIIDRQQER